MVQPLTSKRSTTSLEGACSPSSGRLLEQRYPFGLLRAKTNLSPGSTSFLPFTAICTWPCQRLVSMIRSVSQVAHQQS